jgi:hypothetical protein
MFRRMVLILLAASLLLALASPVGAFDNKRKGFMLGIGLGPAYSSYTQTLEIVGEPSTTSDRQNDAALRTDFRVGFGPTETIQLYWMSKVNWFSMDNALGNSVTIASGVGGLGMTYFLNPTDPSPYLLGGLGFSTWSTPFESGSEAWYGVGLALGAGYQFRNHLALEAGLTWGKPSKTVAGLKASSNAMAIGFTVNYIAF